MTHKGKTVWSGDVKVVANKKTVIYLKRNGMQKTVDWPRGEKLKDLTDSRQERPARMVAVAPVTGNFSVSAANINCGQTSTLNWQSTDTVDANISGIGAVQPSGNQTVEPHATTTYDFTATGPGGSAKGTGTVNVNTTVQASFSQSDGPEIPQDRREGSDPGFVDAHLEHFQREHHYARSEIRWNATSGNQTVKPDPSNTDTGS